MSDIDELRPEIGSTQEDELRRLVGEYDWLVGEYHRSYIRLLTAYQIALLMWVMQVSLLLVWIA